MRMIEQSHSIISCPDHIRNIEIIGRVCYKSEAKITETSAQKLVKSFIKKGHHAMLEFEDITVRFVTNRGVIHELVRHRLASYAQESTRYVKYDDLEIILPVWWLDTTAAQKQIFLSSCKQSEINYRELLALGWKSQQAREVLTNALKTEIVVKANLREWRHILTLRTSSKAHPQIRHLMLNLLDDLKQRVPLIFEDIGCE